MWRDAKASDLPREAMLDGIKRQVAKPDDLTRILSAAAWSPVTPWERFLYRLRRCLQSPHPRPGRQSASAAKYELTINAAPASSDFNYEAVLYAGQVWLGSTRCYTRWGARQWAREVARKYERTQLHHEVVRFDV